MRNSPHKAAHGDAQAPRPSTSQRAEPPPLLVDERPDETGALSLSIGFRDGHPAALILHGGSAALMRRALAKMAAEEDEEQARDQLAELGAAKSRAAVAAERSLLKVE
jgi:hypothetical protein